MIAYHFQKAAILSPIWIPISYAIAMGVCSLTAPLFGHFYDRKGFVILIIVTIISSFFAPLVFLGSSFAAVIFSMLIQLSAVPLLWIVMRKIKRV